MTLFITYLLLSHVPRGSLNLDSQALRKAGSVSWCLTHVCSNHPSSKLVTSCTSKGIWFIRGATPQDLEQPSTCLSKLTFLAISIYFSVCPFMWFCRDTSTGCWGYSPPTVKVCQLLMSLMKDLGLGHGSDMDQFCNCSLKALHNWCIFMVLRLGDGTWGVILLRAGIIDSFPLKLPIF